MKQQNDALKALTVILRASQSIQDVIKKDIAIYGLNPTEFAVLELLYHKGDQPIQVIGKKILMSSGSITYVVDKLELKDYVVRKSCPKDRRVIYATITHAGNQLMDVIFPKHEKKIREIFDQLDRKEIEKVIELMKCIGLRAQNM